MPRLNPFRWPLTITLPVVVSLAMFLVAVGSTQFGVEVLRRASERELQNQAHVFLDAVAGGIAANIPQGRQSVEWQIASALAFQTGLYEEAIAVRWTEEDGTLHTIFSGDRGESGLEAMLERSLAGSAAGTDFIHDREQQMIRMVRTYQGPQGPLAISALFNARSIAETQRTASMVAIAIDILVALVAALATFFLTRRMLAPLERFIFRLAAEDGRIGQSHLRYGSELTRLEHALMLREQSETERASTASRLAQQERDTLLAKLAASIAHEVRNPLAGLKNGVSTLKRFGENQEVRHQTVALLDQGLTAIERVVDVTLSTYRRRSGAKVLSGQDIRDLDLLVGAEARRAGVVLHWNIDPEAQVVTDADAVRQILINLLLNAIRAVPEGGSVTVSLVAQSEATSIAVSDTGRGMSADLIASLVTGKVEALPEERSLGIWMVANLVDQIGARLSIRSEEGCGTQIAVLLPQPSQKAEETTQ